MLLTGFLVQPTGTFQSDRHRVSGSAGVMDQVDLVLVPAPYSPAFQKKKSVLVSCLTFSQFRHSASFSNCVVYGAIDLLLHHHHHHRHLPFSETIPRLRETQLCRATEISPAKSMTVTLHIHQPTDPR